MASHGFDTYDLDVSDDPFDEHPSPTRNAGLGLDHEVAVARRARAPAVKLDEARLLSPAGIPKLRRTAASRLRFAGKGHEFADAARLLAFYQLWLDDLFPKARFLDALAMVEKAGHKKSMIKARVAWIDQPSLHPDPDPDDRHGTKRTPPSTPRPLPSTPPRHGSVPAADDDLYGSTPGARPLHSLLDDLADAPVDEEEDLDALLAEFEMAQEKPVSIHIPPRS